MGKVHEVRIMKAILEGSSWRLNRQGGIMEEQSWRRHPERSGSRLGAILEAFGNHLGLVWGAFGKPLENLVLRKHLDVKSQNIDTPLN